MEPVLFSSKMRLSDLITRNPNVLLMLPRLGISLGFGEATVEEACQRAGVSADFFLLVANVYSFDHYLPSRQVIAQTDMTPLVGYLRKSHRYYADSRLPHIAAHLSHCAQNAGRVGDVVLHFYEDYRREVHEHFQLEETKVFSYIEHIRKGEDVLGFTVREFEKSHGNVEDKLSDLTQIVMKYLPENNSVDETLELFFDVLQLSNDLHKHALIEEKILIPYIEHLERELRIKN